MPAHPELPQICVIGAGASGIAACKIFKEAGIPYDCFEKSDRVGGLWVFKNKNGLSSIYRSLHINTSKRQMEYADYPMPDHYPDFPSHELIVDYFESYVDHFGFRDRITFETEVLKAERQANGLWQITLDDQTVRYYDGLVVANGHHWDPRWPEPRFPGTFEGIEMHSHHYIDVTDPYDFRDKRVVVVGMGNSAMDIACELGRKGNARKVYLSARSGVYITPKYIGNLPIDFINRHPGMPASPWEHRIRKYIPTTVRRQFMGLLKETLITAVVGKPDYFGLPKPSHRFEQAHPTISNEIHARLGSGDIFPKPNIQRLQGNTVCFVDGTIEEVDVMIYATGYKITFPFFDSRFLEAKDNEIPLYLRMMDPRINNLFFLGLVQPLCALMPIAEIQARWMAHYFTGAYHLPSPQMREQATQQTYHAIKSGYVSSKRHTIQINCYDYSYYLQAELDAGKKRAAQAGHGLPVPFQKKPMCHQTRSQGAAVSKK